MFNGKGGIFKIIVFLFLAYLLYACKDTETSNNALETIDIESNIRNFTEVKLSRFHAEIKYLPLENFDNLKIKSINKLNLTSSNLLISDLNNCILYDMHGKYLRKIGNQGRGPSEYVYIVNSGFGFNKNIFIQVGSKFLEYATDGRFISSFDINKEKNNSFYLMSWICLNDTLFFGQVPLSTGQEKSKAILFNRKGKIIRIFNNYIFLQRTTLSFSSDDPQASFYFFGKKIHYKERMNDTLFYLSDEFELKPLTSFKIGSYSIPNEFREIFDSEGNDPFNYIYVNSVFEISDYYLIDCSFGRFTPAKRITPIEVMGHLGWYNTTNVLGLYNKKDKSLVFSKPTSTDNTLFTTGIYNDIDAGPRFYPAKQVNDSTFVMWMDAKQLKDHVDGDDFKRSVAIFPEKKNELKKIADSLNEFDNPVLMFVTFKK